MKILSVDLAAIFSAALVRDENGEILWQADSGGVSAFMWARTLIHAAMKYDVDVILLEDVPYHMLASPTTKSVFRLQGIIMMLGHKVLDKMLFINPGTWQNTYEGVARAPRGMKAAESLAWRAENARVHALNLGYAPPDLIAQYINEQKLVHGEQAKILKKYTNPLAKSMTDYLDAFLMANWASQYTFEELTQIIGVQAPSI